MPGREEGGASASMGGADQEPAAKKQRKLTEADLGGPIENEEKARKKLKDAGFDPDHVTEASSAKCPDGDGYWWTNSICHFAAMGDLKMCRYLVTQGASTTDEVIDGYDRTGWFPMAAAAKTGRKDICRWLYDHGANGDTSRAECIHSQTPLRHALAPWNTPNRDLETAEWLILHGAIPSDADGYPNGYIMEETFRRDIFSDYEILYGLERLLSWAINICSVHDTFFTFLCGTIYVPRLDLVADGPEHRPTTCLSGYQGIRKRIADYVGVVTGRNLRTVRGVVGPLEKALGDGADEAT